ncbi:MAG: hypothetical protein ABW065_12515 [Solirubrobacterales bacterium]
MKIRSASSRRPLATLVAVAACALLALGLSVGIAAGKGNSCAPGAEASGCKLPDGARFYKKFKASSITVQVSGKGFSFSTYGAPIKCTKYAPMLGDEAYVAINLSGSPTPKVGKSYTLKKTETQRGEEGEGTSTTTTEVTLTFKSAKQVTVKLHQLSETDGEIGCDGGATWTANRQS